MSLQATQGTGAALAGKVATCRLAMGPLGRGKWTGSITVFAAGSILRAFAALLESKPAPHAEKWEQDLVP